MSTQLTTVICFFIVGAVIVASQYISMLAQQKEVASADNLLRETNRIYQLMLSMFNEQKVVKDFINISQKSATTTEKHLSRVLEKQESTNKHLRQMELGIINHQGIMDIRDNLAAIEKDIIYHVGIKEINESLKHTNSLIKDNCLVIKNDLGDIRRNTTDIIVKPLNEEKL